jgi:hypothetical protein
MMHTQNIVKGTARRSNPYLCQLVDTIFADLIVAHDALELGVDDETMLKAVLDSFDASTT